MNRPVLTSVVIPAYNAEDYLERTLRSVLQQTYASIEVIVVDDGSTDNTSWTASEVASNDNRVRVIRTENGGVAKARNIGIEAASGAFIAFLDADDLWHPAKLADQVKALTTGAGEQAAASYAQMRIIDWEDRILRNGSGVGTSGYLLARHMFARPVGNGSSLMVRREIAHEFGGFDASWRARGIGGCEDLDLELKIAAKYPIVGLQRYLVGYRSHSANMSSNALTLAYSVLATVEQHLESHPELPSWAVQKIRASTLEYALQNMMAAGEWRVFLSKLSRLYRVDLPRGVEYTVRLSARKLVREVLGVKVALGSSGIRPLFYDLDPDLDAGFSVGSSRTRDKDLLRAFDELDSALAAERARKRAQSSGT